MPGVVSDVLGELEELELELVNPGRGRKHRLKNQERCEHVVLGALPATVALGADGDPAETVA